MNIRACYFSDGQIFCLFRAATPEQAERRVTEIFSFPGRIQHREATLAEIDQWVESGRIIL